MMTKIRRRHSAEFKFRVALEAAKGLKTTSELAQEYARAGLYIDGEREESERARV